MIKYLKHAFLVTVIIIFIFRRETAAQSHPLQYHNYKNMTAFLKDLSNDHSKLMRLETQGKTLGNREIWSVTVSAGNADKNPAVLIVGGVEGVDLVGSEICLQFLQTLVTGYGKVDSITQLLKQSTFYLFPRVSPDASEAFFAAPKYERRLNFRPMDLDKDGAKDEDGYEDMNGDGLITMMRVTDPKGEWLRDKDIPELLRKADHSKGEQGLYRVLREGRDNDGDSKWNEDEPGGVDFNHNFSYNYKFFMAGSGLYQVSEVESRAVTDFAFAHPNITVVFCFSPNDNLMHPPEVQKKGKKKKPSFSRRGRFERKPINAILPQDAAYFNHVAEKFKTITKLSDAPEPRKGEGAFSEWAYYHFGRWSFSVPAWWPPIIKQKPDTNKNEKNNPPKIKKKVDSIKKLNKKDPLANQRRLWKWLQATKQKDKFVTWTEISHPDFPDKKVEIGGFKPYIGINPPPDSLKTQAKRFTDFLLYLGSLLPRVKIEQVKVEHLNDRVYRLRVYITNEGYFPTNTEIGVRTKWNPKVKVTLKLDQDQKLAGGKILNLIDIIPGSGGSEELSWLVVGKRGSKVTIMVGSPMAGADEKVAVLKL